MVGGTAALPAGTVTFLFTDIEGSTPRWVQHPAAMRAALARHDALLHESIAAHGGVVLTERGEGDSFFALFARASDALAAACALQQALAAEPWPEAVAPIRVRMALHTGESGLAEGWDHRGAAVNRCARLRAVAHGGQVLLSGATYELVRDVLPPQVSLHDLGAHRLKDLTRPEQVYQLIHPALPADFPPLKTLDTHRHNLPVQLTPFIGREREVTAVRERLLDPQRHLLTLTGPGGTGKTRLALQVAAEVIEAFPDGVFFVNLAPITDPTLVLPTIAQTLGVVDAGGSPLHETLAEVLREKQLLLVLDNFEQVLDAAVVVSAVLAACPRLRALATSRAALHVRGEREVPVPPLAVPDPRSLPPLPALPQYEAVRLFIARAQDVKPDFAVTNENARAVAEICARLDGLPLAIELAAARIRLLPPQALLARLSRRLALLTGGARDLPDRQQTLRAAIDWSYHLLTPTEQTLFARLAVFVGGGTLDAIEAICNTDGTLDVLEGVESLVAKNLLRPEDGTAGEPRFGMLETIHEYARERLEESGAAEELRWHAAYYLSLAEMVEPQLVGPEQGRWMARLEAEHGNLRAVLSWSRATDATETGLRLAGALWRFWWVRGYLNEGRAWLEDLLARSGEVATAMRAKALRGAGVLAWVQGNYGRATALFEEALALHRDLGDRRGIATALGNLGAVARYQGDYRRATTLYEEALARVRDLGDTHGIAIGLSSLGAVAWVQGDHRRATAQLAEALVLSQAVGDKTWNTAICLEVLAGVACAQGQPERATRLCAAAAALRTATGTPLDRFDRTTYDSIVAAAQEALDDDAFAAAWAVGQALPLEQAIAEALGKAQDA